ncbi:MAG: hydroxyacylglutathione hydrolase, partial [Gammaproteobacteria bacterium]|nr:hydroxyacylglutathione hydrolase [Gammaproteobacteria bacterium]HPQ24864.1 hydroxyacylglutathione hydrolase [Gammaproteobacteria bacterium]
MIDIRPIPAFDDNYIWLISRPGYHGCAVVDPGDDDPVIERLHAEGLSLDAILITHKHGDHVGGVDGLKADWPKAVVYGPAGEPIRSLERRLRGGDRVELDGLGMSFSVLDVPGHTEGHIAYYGHGALFCGDTLFAGGCGRVFSGTFEQLSDSLARIAELPADTRVFCAHEYTLANLGFAAWVEPESTALAAR